MAARITVIAAARNQAANAAQWLAQLSWVDRVVVTDTVRALRPLPERIQVLSVAPLLSEAIRRIHYSESVSSLFID